MTEKSLGVDREKSKASSQAKAGRELDALVMEKVFGREIKWWRGEPSYVTKDEPGWIGESTVPRFSTDLVSAMKVADASTGGWRFTRYSYATKRPFTVVIYRGRGDVDGRSVEAETLPLAICLAALKVVGA